MPAMWRQLAQVNYWTIIFCIKFVLLLNESLTLIILNLLESFNTELLSKDSYLPTVVEVCYSHSMKYDESVIVNPVWGGHSCIDCLLSMRILLPRTNTRENNLTSFIIFCRDNLLRAKLWTVIQCPGHDGKLQPHTTLSEYITVQGVGSGLLVVKVLT